MVAAHVWARLTVIKPGRRFGSSGSDLALAGVGPHVRAHVRCGSGVASCRRLGFGMAGHGSRGGTDDPRASGRRSPVARASAAHGSRGSERYRLDLHWDRGTASRVWTSIERSRFARIKRGSLLESGPCGAEQHSLAYPVLHALFADDATQVVRTDWELMAVAIAVGVVERTVSGSLRARLEHSRLGSREHRHRRTLTPFDC